MESIVISAEHPAKFYEAITVSTTAIGFTDGKWASTQDGYNYGRCWAVFVTVEDANIRFRIDGGIPTTTVGHKLTDGQNLTLTNKDDIKNFLAIRDDAVDASLKVSYRFE